MKVKKEHPFSGQINELELDITQEQLDRWQGGEHIQYVMPNLTPDEREFLISGLLPGEYDSLFDNDEYGEDYYDED